MPACRCSPLQRPQGGPTLFCCRRATAAPRHTTRPTRNCWQPPLQSPLLPRRVAAHYCPFSPCVCNQLVDSLLLCLQLHLHAVCLLLQTGTIVTCGGGQSSSKVMDMCVLLCLRGPKWQTEQTLRRHTPAPSNHTSVLVRQARASSQKNRPLLLLAPPAPAPLLAVLLAHLVCLAALECLTCQFILTLADCQLSTLQPVIL